MRYYTWKDIERELLVQRKGWEDTFDNIEVYPDELIVYCSKEKDDSELTDIDFMELDQLEEGQELDDEEYYKMLGEGGDSEWHLLI